MAKKTGITKKRVVNVEATGQAHIHSSFNNIIVSLCNNNGEVISWSSAGKKGFRGSKKNTPYAAQVASEECSKTAYDLGLRKVKVYVKGPVMVVSRLFVLLAVLVFRSAKSLTLHRCHTTDVVRQREDVFNFILI
jgi:ribosomal protein S11